MERLCKNITVAAVLSAETPDTTGEILDIKNADISALKTGRAPLNTEHINPDDIAKGDDSDFKGFNTIIGRVITAKKIFSEKDCENQYELSAWNDLQVPLIFGYLEFFDGDDAHDNAKAAASIVRTAHKNGFDHLIGFSVEGQILKRDGNRLTDTIIKRVAATAKPANKAARIEGVLSDSSATNKKIKKTSSDGLHVLCSYPSKKWSIVQDFGLSDALFKMRKSLSAGSTNLSPSALSGGSALQVEHQLSKFVKLSSKKLLDEKFLKSIYPEASKNQLKSLIDYLKNARLKKYEKAAESFFQELKKTKK